EAREHAILREHPDLDEVMAVDTRRWRRLIRRPAGLRVAAGEGAAVRRRLRDARFDVAIDLQGLIKSRVLTAATRAPARVGFAATHCRERWSARFTNCRVTPPPDAVHVVEQYLSLLAPLGIAEGPPEFHVPVHRAADRRMEELLVEHGVKRTDRLVAIN